MLIAALVAAVTCSAPSALKTPEPTPLVTASPAPIPTAIATSARTITPPTPTPTRTLTVTASGYVGRSQPTSSAFYLAVYAFTIRNDSLVEAATVVNVSVAFVDDKGVVLAEEPRTIQYLGAGEETGIAGLSLKPGAGSASKITVKADALKWQQARPSPTFAFGDVAYVLQSGSEGEVKGVILSPYSQDYRHIDVSAIGLDSSGRIVGGGSGMADFVPANGKAAVSVNYKGGRPARVVMYGQFGFFTSSQTP